MQSLAQHDKNVVNITLNRYSWQRIMSRVDFRLIFAGKTNRLKEMLIFTILANFMYFPCISDRNLFILLNLLQNYLADKIDHFPTLESSPCTWITQ